MNALHIYEGDCPDELDPDARDFNCEACLGLISIDKLVKGEEQHHELVPVLTGNKKWETVLEKCKELGMVEDYRKGQLDNVLGFIESLAGVNKI